MGLEGEDGDETMLQMATNPLAQPTAMSLGESHVTEVHTVECGFASKTGDCSLSEQLVCALGFALGGGRTVFGLARVTTQFDVDDPYPAISPYACQ